MCAPNQTKQDGHLSQRDRAAGCVLVFAKSRRLELGDKISDTRGRLPPIIFARLVRPIPDSFHTGVTAEALRAKIDDFGPTRSL